MKQVLCTQFSGAVEENITVETASVPEIKEDEVLIQMLAAPINPADLLLITDRHAFTPTLPSHVGIEGVGQVVKLGKNVRDIKENAVVAVPFGGTWRQFMSKKSDDIFQLPSDIDIWQASMICVNPFTAIGLLEGLKKGDWLIQNAANSAIAQMIIRIAAQKGIKTINIVRKESYNESLYKIGADFVIVGEDNLSKKVADITEGEPVKRGLDAVAGNSSRNMYECLQDGSELWCYGLLSSDDIILPANKVIFGDIIVRGYSRLKSVRGKSRAQLKELIDEIVELIKTGVIHSPIQATYGIEDVKLAVQLANQGGRSGKILIDLR